MKITVDANVKNRLEAMVGWIAERSKDKAHENNGDVIADFLDKFIVVELKRLENNPETLPQTLDIPDAVLSEPLTKMKDAMMKTFNDFMDGKGIPQSGGSVNTPAAEEPSEEEEEAATSAVTVNPSGNGSTPRNGNGHKEAFKRKLNDPEKNFIRAEFMKLNGQFEDAKKSCTAMLPNMGVEITVWQITGFVSYLHREIAAGRFKVNDMPSYLSFLENHKKLWAQYNSPKYQKLRANPQPVAQTATGPTLRAGTFKKKTA